MTLQAAIIAEDPRLNLPSNSGKLQVLHYMILSGFSIARNAWGVGLRTVLAVVYFGKTIWLILPTAKRDPLNLVGKWSGKNDTAQSSRMAFPCSLSCSVEASASSRNLIVTVVDETTVHLKFGNLCIPMDEVTLSTQAVRSGSKRYFMAFGALGNPKCFLNILAPNLLEMLLEFIRPEGASCSEATP